MYRYYVLLQHAVEALWLTIKDLLEESKPAEVRQLTLEFIAALVSGQVCVHGKREQLKMLYAILE